MSPEDILSIYGVDVTKLSTPYSSYKIATNLDLWLRVVGADSLLIDDLIIKTPDNYRSRIYTHKIPSRHVNLTGPDFYYYTYHPAYFIDILENCIKKYLEDWIRANIKGTLAFNFDDDVFHSKTVFIQSENNMASVSDYYAKTLHQEPLDSVIYRWGKRNMVQNYLDQSNMELIHCGFIGD